MIVNLLDAEPGDADDRDRFRFFDRWVAGPLGAELLGCSLYDLPPGEQLWPYHFHLGNEEWAVVVAGAPTVRTPEGERELVPGDIVAFPEGEAGAHTFLNRSDGRARLRCSRPSTVRRCRCIPTAARSARTGTASVSETESTTGTASERRAV